MTEETTPAPEEVVEPEFTEVPLGKAAPVCAKTGVMAEDTHEQHFTLHPAEPEAEEEQPPSEQPPSEQPPSEQPPSEQPPADPNAATGAQQEVGNG